MDALTKTAIKLMEAGHLKLGKEVKRALLENEPIVALESTIITQYVILDYS